MIGWFDEKKIKKVLGISASKRVELIITLGYSLSKKREKRRKPREETVSFNGPAYFDGHFNFFSAFFILFTASTIRSSEVAYDILMQSGAPNASPPTIATCALSRR